MIRCLGGQVSWDNTAAPGSTFNVEDTSVTHQICDRPRDSVDMKHIERFYIQPQWVSHTAQKEIFPFNFQIYQFTKRKSINVPYFWWLNKNQIQLNSYQQNSLTTGNYG